MGVAQTRQPLDLDDYAAQVDDRKLFQNPHHPCLGLTGGRPYSVLEGKLIMSAHATAELLKQQIPLLEYLVSLGWQPARHIARGRLMGLCPLHADRKPSFLIDPGKNLFYCYGCSRGGDVIRFVELHHSVSFGEAITLLRRWSGMDSLLSDVIRFYQLQLHRHPEAVAYLMQRGVRQPELVEQMRIGYAPGRCLRAWLMSLGHGLDDLQQAGFVTREGFDAFAHRIVFPLDNNLHGRSIGNACPHRFLPGGKGGLYGRQSVCNCHQIVLVEGLFDWAVLWQAGLRNVACSLGTGLNAAQMNQLCDGAARTVLLAFDSDHNGSGQRSAHQNARRLWSRRVEAYPVELPAGHDPNSFFAHGGGDAHQFQALLERACS
jgi:DNA primase